MALTAIAEPLWLNLKVKKGDSFQRVFSISQNSTAVDLTGYEVSSQIRDLKGKTLANFTAAVTDAVNGEVTISLTTNQTRRVNNKASWDLQLVLTSDPLNNTHTLVEGDVIVTNDRTR